MSKISDDILKQIQSEIDRIGEAPSSLDELNKIAANVVDRFNNAPKSDFEGLSPYQMHILLHRPFSPECIVKFGASTGINVADKSPVVKISLLIINAIIAQNGLALTKGGKLPRKIVDAIYNLNFHSTNSIPGYYKRTLNELDYAPAAITNALLKLSGLVIIRKNKLHLTKAGKSAEVDHMMLFRSLFTAFSTRFNKGYLDGYGSDTIGNLGTLYTIYLLNSFGKKRLEASFYARLYFKAFPELINEVTYYAFSTPEKTAYDCFLYRIFEKGLLLFGLVEIEFEGKDYFDRKMYIKTSDLFHQIFKI
ncbi:MAG TPA: hypothetical protein PLZ75_10080 [Bacteroidales bacterium]|nr:hypothetical protein [Bacteroidales bacterium]HQH23034.1 hypothetical protein [Bacteroidales bacterium]